MRLRKDESIYILNTGKQLITLLIIVLAAANHYM